MRLRLSALVATLLLAGTAQAAGYNGRVHGSFAGQAIDVPVVCESPRLAGQKGNWFYAQSDPPTHEYAQDRNGDGVAVTVSFSGQEAMFMLFLGGQDHNFGNTRREQITLTDSGFVLTMTASRYEGRGTKRRKVGEDEIRLAVDCPRR
ncbi:MAG TPA: hypothetical protein PK214_10945 [Ottowia sp.]|jgi:hypothetical protein|nr:hypothetical protein [Ottowia sp.]OJV50644.1 MAG: hypothetical protein BGO36_00895 [Burkholderiales bacterium 68-10]HMT83074.1 hypothetical protein [Ottowia sp.]HOK12676.1 hypothetical protein [Ottowia sp.]HOM21457.1 hypothetical protein [Ottowia sp.]